MISTERITWECEGVGDEIKEVRDGLEKKRNEGGEEGRRSEEISEMIKDRSDKYRDNLGVR